jgi:hypothetical protein
MTKLQTKMKLEVLKTQIHIEQELISSGLWKTSDSPYMHKHYVKRLKEHRLEYLETIREILVPNETYVFKNFPYIKTKTDIVKFLYKNMTFGQLQNEHDNYLFDKSTPFAKHKYCEFGETMDDNKSEIIECLYVSEWEFNVNPNGVTIITGRPYDWDDESVYVLVNKNIFDTDLILNISLASI